MVEIADVRLGLYGAPAVGKTTVVQRLVGRLQDAGVSVGGFVTTEVRSGQRVGFRCQDLTGPQGMIAHIDWDTGPQVGRYRVDVAAFESIALPAIDRAAATRQIVVIDEIAAMELLSTAFVQRIFWLLDQALPTVLTMHHRPHPVTDALRDRSDIQLLKLTHENRQNMAELLYGRLCRDLTGTE